METKKTELQLKKESEIAEFGLNDLLTVALTFVVVAIGTAYGLNVLSDVRSGFDVNSIEYNATTDGMTGVAKFPNKLPLLATIVVAAIIIGILVRYLYVRFN